jgi:IS30 family transposase
LAPGTVSSFFTLHFPVLPLMIQAEARNTLTLDNGKEFAAHAGLSLKSTIGPARF